MVSVTEPVAVCNPQRSLRRLRASALYAAPFLSILCTTCASTEEKSSITAANFPDASTLRRVAVLQFTGTHSDDVTRALEAALVAHRVDNTPYFSVMDPTHVAEVARGVREVTPATAARFKSAGLQGVFFGHVDAYAINSGSHTERESKCVRYSSSGKHCKEQGSTNVTFY